MGILKQEVDEFEKRFGGAWIGVKFYFDSDHPDAEATGGLRFCKAIQLARRGSIVLRPENVECPGARRSFGWNPDPDDRIADALANNQSVDTDYAREMLPSAPRMDRHLHAVGLETEDEPDILVSYAQPSEMMRVVRAFETAHKKPLGQSLSSILTVCANVAVKSFLSGEICMSFGCEFSRKSSGIGRDRMAVGIPCGVIGELTGSIG